MANYCVVNELRSINFHDSLLNRICIESDNLQMFFVDAIIIGHSCPEIESHIPCSVNSGEDRYACPELKVTVHNFTMHSVLRGGCWTQDAEGNMVEKYPPRNLLPEEYAEFMQMAAAEKNNLVYGITFDTETHRYALSFFMNADANYYEIEFTGNAIVAEFDEFGNEAWYLERYRKKRQQN
ncbi:MAG: hypothetical protein E7448_02735 [Ruminococcaceae bacterium]|nr:hypothetical protein [Oscillospiraceae bacterium]